VPWLPGAALPTNLVLLSAAYWAKGGLGVEVLVIGRTGLTQAFDNYGVVWHTVRDTSKAQMETSSREAVAQRVRDRCEPDARAPPKILPEPPTETTEPWWSE